MKKLALSFALSLCVMSANAAVAFGQTATTATTATPAQTADAGITPNRVIGDVTIVDQTAKGLSIKTTGGAAVLVILDDKTVFLRAQPGATSLAGATKITLADVGVGDRVLALGKVADDKKSIPARQLIVMTKADIARKHETDREQWRRRGIVGNVTALNPETKEITVSVRTRGGLQPIVVAVTDKVLYRRYAPDSVKFADAKPGTFDELKVGDQLRALGERNGDGARFTPEEIVSGSFRQVLGTVTAVNPETNEIKMTGVQDKKPFAVVVNADTSLRRLPPMAAMMLAQRAAGGNSSGGGDGPGTMGGAGSGGGRPAGEGQPQRQRPPTEAGGAAAASGGPPPQGGGPRRMMGGGGFDAQEMLERLPPMPLAELKPGDVIVVSSTNGADPTRLNAIALVAGVDAILNAMQAQQGRPASGPAAGAGANTGLPAGIDFGIGLP